jgi:chromosome segregation protein
VAPLAEARAGLESRVETLGESIPPEHGTGSLLDGVEAGLLGVLAERLRVAQGAEAAVAAALMGAQSALITADTDVLERVAQAAANGVDGNVWLLNRLQESRSSNSVQLPPGAAWVIDSVDCEEADRAVVSGLLDGTVLAEDDVQAQALVTDLHVTAVTRQGHRWDEHGLRIGAGDTSSLAKRAKLEQAEYELRSAQEAEEKARSEYARVEPLLTEAQARLKTLEEEARNTAEASRKAAAEVNRLESLSRQATAEAERAEAGVERTGAAVSQATQQLDELDLRLENAQAVPAEEEPSTDERDRLAKVAEAARAHEMQTRLDLRAAEEANRRRTERINGLKRAAARERQARFQAELRARRRAQQAQRAERVAELATAAQDRLHASVWSAQAALNAAEAQQRRLSAHLDEARGALNRAKEEVTRLNDSAHAEEVLAAERAARLENLQERILEEVGMTPEYLLEHFGPQLPVPVEDDPNDRWAALRVEVDEDGNPVSGVPYDRAEQEKRLKRAEKDLAALGKINPLALEEFAALEERHTYLTGQLDDLKSSRADLLDLVRQVDEHVREVFSSAYEETAVEFKRIFGRLFPGGEGELVLTEPEDMLTTGIEVHARPAGKKVKRLSLLSGGERSLTAIAMLVAIFTARPSPFYVMDEVEAALDERNLLRLLGVFSDLREHSQLIIITHQKHTMDIADALYGVSMRGDGITQVISQKVGGHEGSPT